MPAEPRSLVGQQFVDASGRKLRVDSVRRDDPAGRDICGVLLDSNRAYTCTAQTFRDVWIECAPATTVDQQEQVRKSLKL